MSAPVSMTGKKCGRLTVNGFAGIRDGQQSWNCVCDCGTETVVRGHPLRSGRIRSCGCLLRELSRCRMTTHGQSRSPVYQMMLSAKQRAKLLSVPFDLALDDMPTIPNVCPILGISLKANTGNRRTTGNSPSLDRVVPSVGYVKGNVRIISHRANQIKSDATPEELMKVARDAARNTLIAGAGFAHERCAECVPSET